MVITLKDEINIDQFTATIRKIGDSLGFIIPSPNAKFSGLQPGDFIKVYYKRIEPNPIKHEGEMKRSKPLPIKKLKELVKDEQESN